MTVTVVDLTSPPVTVRVNCTVLVVVLFDVEVLVCVGRMLVAKAVGTGLIDDVPEAVEHIKVVEDVTPPFALSCARAHTA